MQASALLTPHRVVHVGQSALVLSALHPGQAPSRQVIVTRESAGLMPDGICLDEHDFPRVRDLALGILREGVPLDLTGWTEASVVVDRVDLRLDVVSLDAAGLLPLQHMLEDEDSDELSPSSSAYPIRRQAAHLAAEALGRPTAPTLLRSIVGAGPGTTPTGDDMIVGALAGLRALGLRAEWVSMGRRLRPLTSRTTSASRHYLHAAIEGRFGEHVHDLVAAIAGCEPAVSVIERASTWGASSGIDLLTGLTATVAASIQSRPNESAA